MHLRRAQVRALHGRIALQGDRRAFADDPAGLDQLAAIGDVETLFGVLLHQQDSHAGLADRRQRWNSSPHTRGANRAAGIIPECFREFRAIAHAAILSAGAAKVIPVSQKGTVARIDR